MSEETVKEFQKNFDTLNSNEKLDGVGQGIKALVALGTLFLSKIPKPHTIIDQVALRAPEEKNTVGQK